LLPLSLNSGQEDKRKKETKETRIENAKEEINTQLLQLATFTQLPLSGVVHNKVRVIVNLTEGSPDECATFAVNALPLVQVRKLQTSFFANNRDDGRMRALAKELFATDMGALTDIRRVLNMCESAMTNAATLLFISQFVSEEGSYLWDLSRKMINKCVEDKVAAEAAEAARRATTG